MNHSVSEGRIPFPGEGGFKERLIRLVARDKWLAGIFCFSVVLKLLFALADPVVNPDGVLYISAAKEIAAGRFRAALALYPMPFFPLLIAAVHTVVPDWVTAARLPSILAAVGALFPLYFLTRELFGIRAARWSCLAYAIVPLPNEWAMDVIRGPVFIFCLAWAVYFGARSMTRLKIGDPLLALGWALAAVLFRIEGVAFLPVLMFAPLLLLALKPAERGHWRKVMGLWLLVPAAGMLVAGVMAAAETSSFNRLNEVADGIRALFKLTFLHNYHAIYDALKGLEGTPPFSNLSQNILAITRHYLAVVYGLGLLETFFRVLFPVFMIPLFMGLHRPWPRPRRFVLAAVAAYLLLLYFFLIQRDYLQYRFVFAPVFLLYPFVGRGMDRIWDWGRQHFHPRAFAALFAAFFILIPLAKTGSYISTQDDAVREAGQWLGGVPELAPARVLTTDIRIPFYAGKMDDATQFLACPPESDFYYAALEKEALQGKADLIAIKARKGRAPFDGFGRYRLMKSIKGHKDWVYFYRILPP